MEQKSRLRTRATITQIMCWFLSNIQVNRNTIPKYVLECKRETNNNNRFTSSAVHYSSVHYTSLEMERDEEKGEFGPQMRFAVCALCVKVNCQSFPSYPTTLLIVNARVHRQQLLVLLLILLVVHPTGASTQSVLY